MKPVHLLLAAIMIVIWGVNFVVGKIGVAEIPPILLMTMRFALIALILCPLVKLPRTHIRHYLILSVLMGSVHFACMFTALRDINASLAAVLAQLGVPFASILAAIILKDKLGWRRALGMALAFGGIFLLAGEPQVHGDLVPILLIAIAAFAWALGVVYIKRQPQLDGHQLNAWTSALAAPQLLIATFLFETGQWNALQNASWQGWFAAAYMAIFVTIVGYAIWYFLVRRYDVNQTMPLTLLSNVFGILSGVVLLGETMSWQMVIGTVLAVVGVGIIVVRRPKLAPPEV